MYEEIINKTKHNADWPPTLLEEDISVPNIRIIIAMLESGSPSVFYASNTSEDCAFFAEEV